MFFFSVSRIDSLLFWPLMEGVHHPKNMEYRRAGSHLSAADDMMNFILESKSWLREWRIA